MTDLAVGLRSGWMQRSAVSPLPSPPASSGISVGIRGIGKSFGPTPVLRGIDLEIRSGEFVAVVGHSGCGKTTLLRLLAGLDKASEGSITLDGEEFEGASSDTRIMFQDSRLLPWRRVLDNVAIGRRGPGWRDEAHAALARVGLGDKADVWPSTLSGGQRQRVALARALISHPRFLLLDEPLGALDALTRLEMQALIEEVWQTERFTALLVTHDVVEAVGLADRVVVLEQGRIGAIWDVPLHRPRHRAAAERGEIESAILSRLLKRPGN